MIGFNGGLIGAKRTANGAVAPGVWTLDEQLRWERDRSWPVAGDPDASAYIRAVEVADGQLLEDATRTAISTFVAGCKTDGIWNAIKASCILAGARTLNGALVPLVGAAPTNFNFVSGDYNRKTGLKGNGSTKYLDSNRNNNADPQNSKHAAAFFGTNFENTGIVMGARSVVTGTTYIDTNGQGSRGARIRINEQYGVDSFPNVIGPALIGGTNGPTQRTYRWNNATITVSAFSQTPASENILIFARKNNTTGTPESFSLHRLAFYSIGEALDLAMLDARVTALINAFGAAIP